ncbi:MAG: hypothetical protein JEZ02_18450 [Desulfatibacillum sp.]|nr:hypothetical protein [Desulfatibacillum sp.]
MGVLPEFIRNALSTRFEVRLVSKEDAEKSRNLIHDADVLLEVNYLYGIAAYVGESSSPVVVANLKVTDLARNSIILEKALSSDTHYRMNDTVEGFSKNNCETFLGGIREASQTLSFQIAEEFGIQGKENASGTVYDSINFNEISCKRPFNLTQDCSNWSGATRKIQIDDVSINVAGSDCGKAILIMPGTGRKTELKDAFTLGLMEYNSGPSRVCLDKVRSVLEARGLRILKITKVPSRASVRGYVLALDGDGYSFLKGYAKK